MKSVESALRWLANALAVAGLGLLCFNALATVADVAMRAALSRPIDRLSDVSSVIYFLAAACCVPAATAHRRHITIRLFEGQLAPRLEAGIEALASAAMLLIWCVIAQQLWLHAAGMAKVAQTLSQIDIEVAPFWYFVALCMSFNAVLEVFNLLRWCGSAWSGRSPNSLSGAGGAGDLL